MPQTYEDAKGRGKPKLYLVYHAVVEHPRWAQLSPYAKVLWLELGLQYRPQEKTGRKRPDNNGWIACPFAYLIEQRGFKSRSTIKEALQELEWFGFIEVTSPGKFPKHPARYALTHLDIPARPEANIRARKAPHTYREHDGTPFTKRPRSKNSQVPLASSPVTAGGTMDHDRIKHRSPGRTLETTEKVPKVVGGY